MRVADRAFPNSEFTGRNCVMLVIRQRREHVMRKGFVRLGVESLERRDNPSGGWSFWDDTYIGAVFSGRAQGTVNLVNGVQDAAVGVANLPGVIYNNTAGNLGGGTIGYIPSPDWSRDLIYVGEPTHGLSKFLGGNGIIILATLGAGSAGTVGAAGEAAAAGTEVAGMVAVASEGVGAVQTATIVRTIGRGEMVADLIQEVAGLTYNAGGAEHAIITLQTGERLIVQGGQAGISLEMFSDTLRRIILHTHPTTTGPSATDIVMLEQLGQKSSWIYELFGGGLTKFAR